MSAPDSELEQHLRALFGGLDTRADFHVRLMARLRAESQTEAAERSGRARQREWLRYRELRSGSRIMLHLVALDLLGIALLATAALVAVWPILINLDVRDASQPYWPYIAILFAILVAAIPVLGMWVAHTRKPIRLL